MKTFLFYRCEMAFVSPTSIWSSWWTLSVIYFNLFLRCSDNTTKMEGNEIDNR